MRDKKLTKWRKSWKSLKKPWGSRLEWDESIWERKERAIKREIERNKGQIARGSLNRPSVNLDKWRCQEVLRQLLRKVSRKWSSTDTGIEEVSRNKLSEVRTEAQSIHQLSRSCWWGKSYRGGRSFLDLSTRYREAIEVAIWKNLRNSTNSKVSKRCRWGVKLAFKSSFREVKNTDMNTIQHATQPMIQTPYKPLKINSQQQF